MQKVLSAIRSFINPFNISNKDRLYSLASGAPIPNEVEVDVLRAGAAGKQAKELFIQQRFKQATLSFFQPIKRQNLFTMEACNKKVMLSSSQGKVRIVLLLY